MEQRDILKDQIEQLGKVLGKVVASFLKHESALDVMDQINQLQKSLQEELDIDLEWLLNANNDERALFLKQRNFNEIHLELLLKCIVELIQKDPHKASTKEKQLCAIHLIELIDETTLTFSMERQNLKDELKPE